MDKWGRPLGNLRLSVTDRCNLRCQYCMPERDYVWLPRKDILDFEEVSALVDVFADLGVDRVRLTGGEPLVRRDLPELVRMIASKPAIRDLAMTTNGVLLAENAGALKDAGLRRVTVSLDTLKPERFHALTRFDDLARVLKGIEVASGLGFSAVKIDSVVIRGVNEDELVPLLEHGRRVGAEVRFIEYMDVGGATRWSRDKVVPRAEILGTLARHYGPIQPLAEKTSAPAERFRLSDGTVFGIIASTTAPFCGSCDRSRLTADGLWYLCLYAARGLNLALPLRAGSTRQELRALIEASWRGRTDRGAEDRLALRDRAALVPLTTLRRDPHLEMHTRGG
ncbi:MAG TPA: GTP 3',8-cyclase MoaA [Thermoanaerobaculia bacterium]|nr:GTP 3',8-cyclase MoaA [Thermoanaerobaculia bacterium]